MARRKKAQGTIGDQLAALSKLNEENGDFETLRIERRATYNYAKVDWNEVRKAYILGKRVIEKDELGIERIWSENYTKAELAELFDIPYKQVSDKSNYENWNGLREAYIVKTQQQGLERELSYFANEELQAQQQALGMTKKITTLVNLRLQAKYGNLLEAYDESAEDILEEILEQIPDMEELSDMLGVLSSAYKVQKQILTEVPRTDTEMLDELNQRKAVNSLQNKAERDKLKEMLMSKMRMLSSLDD